MHGQEIAEALEHNRRVNDALIGKARSLSERLQQAGERLRMEALGACLELAEVYLPTLDVPTLERVATLTGFRGFQRRDPLKAMEHERTSLQHLLQRTFADERYERRTYLVGPHGEYTRTLNERRSMQEPWNEECAKFESQPLWDELIASHYDTPRWTMSWMTAQYWRLWRAGDAICDALGMSDFGDDVLPAFRKVDAERRKWQEMIAEAEGKVAEVHELVRTFDQASDRLAHLPETFLAAAQQGLREFLQGADLGLLEEWAGREGAIDPGIQSYLRRAAGLAAKVEMLDALHHEALDEFIAGLERRGGKWPRKIMKFNRPKHRYVEQDGRNADSGYLDKVAKYEGRLAGFDKLMRRILDYEDYDRFQLDNDPELWWIEFTSSKPPRQLSALRGWYERNPVARPRRQVEPRVRQAAVAQAATRDPSPLSYLS